jgi:arsenate reductase
MNKVYYLGNCSTCKKIIDALDLKKKKFEFQDIKEEPITPAQLDEMAKLAGGYEPLFSRIAMKYRAMGLNTMTLTEKDYRRYILEEYTFLKRPTIIMGKQIFIGSAKNTVAAAKEAVK